ncbi:MAG: C1 family peptidase [Marinifilaceae bacterium]
MKKHIILATILVVTCMLSAQAKKEKKGKELKFTDITKCDVTSVKNQQASGTCWCFSGLSFLESELLRLGKGEHDLSEMFLVKKSYEVKSVDYIRYHTQMAFSQGGESGDVMEMIKKYGLMPEALFKGLNYGTTRHQHGEVEAVLKGILDGVAKNKNRRLSTAWQKAFNNVLDAYFGKDIKTFTYKGKEYTPESLRDALAIVPDDYVEIGSFSHHDFYTQCAFEVPDNWMHSKIYNLPLDVFMELMDSSLKGGYSLLWGSDVSEKGFKSRKGIAILPAKKEKEMSDSEIGKWEKLSKKEKKSGLFVKEQNVTQESRQIGFDNYQTEDDHGMHMMGISEDQFGKKYYKIKNSWGLYGKYKGYFYASEAFVKAKTMTYMVHKDALSKELKAKLGIK